MKQVRVLGSSDMFASLRSFFAGVVLTLTVFGASCDDGPTTDGGGLTNVSQSAPRLEEFDETGAYVPYKGTADMNRPRYFHEGIFSVSGLAFVFGGTDERGLSSLETVEFFDQAAVDKDELRPDTGTGSWFDTNFEGDEIIYMNGPRVFNTLTILANGTVISIGGTNDIQEAQQVYEKPEVFDPETRSFELLDEPMIQGRFRHTTIPMFDGNLLVIGGQRISTITTINTDIEPGQVGRQEQSTVFLSTTSLEVFSLTEETFAPFTLADDAREVTLNTPRGRAGHTVGRLAGFDRRLGSADDVFVILGGYQTLSGQNAPQTKAYGVVGREEGDALTVVEFFDPLTRVITQAANIGLEFPRIDTPHALNLGKFNDYTIDGTLGMGNALLVMGGNSDGVCADSRLNRDCELFVATFTGLGPAQGIQFFEVESLETGSQIQGVELPSGFFIAENELVGRAQTNPVAMPRRLVSSANVSTTHTWIFFLGGSNLSQTILGCDDPEAFVTRTGAVFDPFFNLRGVRVNGTSARNLITERTTSNPLGIVGTWLSLDGDYPTLDDSRFSTTSPDSWARMVAANRVYARIMAIPGADGLIGTPDDRILLSGGGAAGGAGGGEPAAPSAEVFLPPGLNSTAPSD